MGSVRDWACLWFVRDSHCTRTRGAHLRIGPRLCLTVTARRAVGKPSLAALRSGGDFLRSEPRWGNRGLAAAEYADGLDREPWFGDHGGSGYSRNLRGGASRRGLG